MYISSADIDQQIVWSRTTFGYGTREKGIIEHIKKELKEIEQAETPEEKFEEWIDVMILAIDGAWRSQGNYGAFQGLNLVKKYLKKMKTNYDRKWPDHTKFSEDEAIEHVRDDALPSD